LPLTKVLVGFKCRIGIEHHFSLSYLASEVPMARNAIADDSTVEQAKGSCVL
jgi:hypothetical protein